MDSGGTALPYPPQDSELVMEANSVEELGESDEPEVEDGGVLEIDACGLLIVVDESDA